MDRFHATGGSEKISSSVTQQPDAHLSKQLSKQNMRPSSSSVYNSSSKNYPISGAPSTDPQLVNNNNSTSFYPDSYQKLAKPVTTKERKPFTFYNHAGITNPVGDTTSHHSNIAAHH